MLTLETKRLLLREFKLNDAEDVFAFTKLSEVANSAGWPPYKSIAETTMRIKNFIDKQEVYAIELKEEKRVIGTIGVHHTSFHSQVLKTNKRQIGFSIHPNYWNKGYATEALEAVIQCLFLHKDIDRIYCSFITGNIASKRVMEKCGFVFFKEKEARLEFLKNGDTVLQEFKITREMYQKKKISNK